MIVVEIRNFTNESIITSTVSYLEWYGQKNITGDKEIKMQAVLYSNGNQECERMSFLLKKLDAQILEYKLNNHFTQRSFESEFGSEATYPQVSLGYNHIGNMKETLKYFKDRLLI